MAFFGILKPAFLAGSPEFYLAELVLVASIHPRSAADGHLKVHSPSVTHASFTSLTFKYEMPLDDASSFVVFVLICFLWSLFLSVFCFVSLFSVVSSANSYLQVGDRISIINGSWVLCFGHANLLLQTAASQYNCKNGIIDTLCNVIKQFFNRLTFDPSLRYRCSVKQ